MEFQKIEFTITKGYFWTGKRDYRIQEVIKNIFSKRYEYKNEIDPITQKKKSNPMEQIYKLIMNSSYGKQLRKHHCLISSIFTKMIKKSIGGRIIVR